MGVVFVCVRCCYDLNIGSMILFECLVVFYGFFGLCDDLDDFLFFDEDDDDDDGVYVRDVVDDDDGVYV